MSFRVLPWLNRLAVVTAVTVLPLPAAAADYPIQPQPVAAGSWVVLADTGYLHAANGGFAVNTAFFNTGDGVVVIGSGPSRAFGEQYRRTIAASSAEPVRELWLSHSHPDHFLGNQAFADVPIRADATTTALLRAEADGLAENMYRLVGSRMHGTEPLLPNATLTGGERRIGNKRLQLLALAGHTPSDIAVFDPGSGVLYAIDLVFNGRTPTLPRADIAAWLAALDTLEALPFKVLVPGHGPVAHDAAPIRATRRYLQWLDATLRDAALRGLSTNEAMALPIAAEFAAWAEARAEWRRSVGFLYHRYEQAALPLLAP